jgi:hypothetical protein
MGQSFELSGDEILKDGGGGGGTGDTRSRLHERTISLRFLGIILRVLRLEVFCIDFLYHREGGMVSYPVFFLSSLQKTKEVA